MYSISPLVPVYDENQTYGYGLTDMSVDGTKMEFPTNRNVMADDHYKDRKYTGYDITGNIGLTMNLAPSAYIQNKHNTYDGYYYNDRYPSCQIQKPMHKSRASILITTSTTHTIASKHSRMY